LPAAAPIPAARTKDAVNKETISDAISVRVRVEWVGVGPAADAAAAAGDDGKGGAAVSLVLVNTAARHAVSSTTPGSDDLHAAAATSVS